MWKGLLNLLHNWVYFNYFVQHICWILILKFYGQILKFTNSWNCPCMPILKFVKLLTRQYNWFAIKSAIKDLLHSPSWEDKRNWPKQQNSKTWKQEEEWFVIFIVPIFPVLFFRLRVIEANVHQFRPDHGTHSNSSTLELYSCNIMEWWSKWWLISGEMVQDS